MQLSIFSQEKKIHKPAKHNKIEIFVDGASRNNPGPAAAGIFIKKNGAVFTKRGYYLNKKTNNEAEYLALVLALIILELSENLSNEDNIKIVSDSKLLISQLNGSYAVKKPELKKLHEVCKHYLRHTDHELKHVLRENNKVADALANKGLDDKIQLEPEILQVLADHDIKI